ncbi:MAG: MFS transporter [Ignavibacteria bacterium]|nr:MFS transporter [Ignavibacteria bacterium]
MFTFVSIMLLRDKVPAHAHEKHALKQSFKQLSRTLRDLARYPQTLRFFIAYLLYNDAIQTVIAMASVYGAEELDLGLDVLTQAILLVQFVAIGGSLIFAWLAERINHQTRHHRRPLWLVCCPHRRLLLGQHRHTLLHSRSRDRHRHGAPRAALPKHSEVHVLSRYDPQERTQSIFPLYEISDSWHRAGSAPKAFGLALSLTNSLPPLDRTLPIILIWR